MNFAQLFYFKSASNCSQSRSKFTIMNYFDIAIYIDLLNIYRGNGYTPLVHYKLMGPTLHFLKNVDGFLFVCFLQLCANSETSF